MTVIFNSYDNNYYTYSNKLSKTSKKLVKSIVAELTDKCFTLFRLMLVYIFPKI